MPPVIPYVKSTRSSAVPIPLLIRPTQRAFPLTYRTSKYCQLCTGWAILSLLDKSSVFVAYLFFSIHAWLLYPHAPHLFKQVQTMIDNNTSNTSTLVKDSRKQAQLRKPFMERQLRFTKEGYMILKQLQAENEDKIQRRISESVLLDILLTQKPQKYSI